MEFYGGVLHVCYAPEYETVDETRWKLQERRITIARKCRQLGMCIDSNEYEYQYEEFAHALQVYKFICHGYVQWKQAKQAKSLMKA